MGVAATPMWAKRRMPAAERNGCVFRPGRDPPKTAGLLDRASKSLPVSQASESATQHAVDDWISSWLLTVLRRGLNARRQVGQGYLGCCNRWTKLLGVVEVRRARPTALF